MSRSVVAAVVAVVACGGGTGGKPRGDDDAGPPRDADAIGLPPAPPLPGVPAGLPTPELPASVTPEAVALGELLFWDPRLSSGAAISCATCHDPAHGYASAKRMPTAAGKPYPRRAPTLENLAWHKELGWDGRYATMAEHLDAHMRTQFGNDLAAAVARIAELPGYRAQFARLGGAPTAERAATALGAFALTRYQGDTSWDRAERSGDATADAKAGYQLFQTKAQCSVCHTPPLYSDLRYHRLGLISSPDDGRGRVEPAQKGAFKTPTLRGAARRTGFFHDASAATLDAAIDWHLAGGTGQGADPSIIDPALRKLALSKPEREQLGAFIRGLTGDAVRPAKPVLP